MANPYFTNSSNFGQSKPQPGSVAQVGYQPNAQGYAQPGPYGAEGFIRQALAPLPDFSGQYPVLGSWLVGDTPCGLSIREDENPITGNLSRFVPHAIV